MNKLHHPHSRGERRKLELSHGSKAKKDRASRIRLKLTKEQLEATEKDNEISEVTE